MLIQYHAYYLLLTLICSQGHIKNTHLPIIYEINPTTSSVVGEIEMLQFISNTPVSPWLYLSNSYASTIQKPKTVGNNLFYTLPKHFANTAGDLNWSLVYNQKVVARGKKTLVSSKKHKELHSYLGTNNLVAGSDSFTEHILIPTDAMGNPVEDHQEVTLTELFKDQKFLDTLSIRNFVTIKKIYPPNEEGRMLLSAKVGPVSSKEQTIDITPSYPQDFTINSKRIHNYADGNQTVKLYTDLIKDPYGNTIVDGTMVTFLVTTENKLSIISKGFTIDGIAETNIQHPDRKSEWSIKAYVDGFAESNVLTLGFRQVIKDFTVHFTDKYKNIRVHDLQSFMEQPIPDGMIVEMQLWKKGLLQSTSTKTSKDGQVSFVIDPNNYQGTGFSIIIECSGIRKTFKNISL